MQEIGTTQVTVRKYEGKEAVLIFDEASGQVIGHGKKGDKMKKVFCQVSQKLLVGTDEEIEAEKAKQDEKYAPIKAQKEEAAEAARAAAKEARTNKGS